MLSTKRFQYYFLYSLLFCNALGYKPGAPKILGSLTPQSPTIKLGGVNRNALKVIVKDSTSGAILATGTTGNDYLPHVLIPLDPGQSLILGHYLIAQQTTSDGVSEWSKPSDAQVVPLFIAPLAIPCIISRVHTCSSAVKLENLVRGANVFIFLNGALLGSATAEDSVMWVPFDPRIPLTAGDEIAIHQSIEIDGEENISLATIIKPLMSFADLVGDQPFSQFEVQEPLKACDNHVNVLYGTPGSNVEIRNSPYGYGVRAPDFEYNILLYSYPLVEDQIQFTERLPRCPEIPDRSKTFSVEAGKPPSIPIYDKTCSSARRLYFSGLYVPGLMVITKTDSNGVQDHRQWTIDSEETDFGPLPDDWNLDEQGVKFSFFQSNQCGSSDERLITTMNEPPNTLLRIESAIECTRIVGYTSGPTSGDIRVLDDSGRPLSRNYKPQAGSISYIETYDFLNRLQTILLHETGCGTDCYSDSVQVKAMNNLDPPILKDDIFVPAESIKVYEVIPGATVRIYVDGIESGSTEARGKEVLVPIVRKRVSGVPYRLPVEVDPPHFVVARQFLDPCQLSSGASGARKIQKGRMTFYNLPSYIAKGRIEAADVIFFDELTGRCPPRTDVTVDPQPYSIEIRGPCRFVYRFNIPRLSPVTSINFAVTDSYRAYDELKGNIVAYDPQNAVVWQARTG